MRKRTKRPCGDLKKMADLTESPNVSEKEINIIDTFSAVIAQEVLAASLVDDFLKREHNLQLIQQNKCSYLLTGEGVYKNQLDWIPAGEALAKMDSDSNCELYSKVEDLLQEGKLDEANEAKKLMIATMPMARPRGLSEDSMFHDLQFKRYQCQFEWNGKVLLDYDSHSKQKTAQLIWAIKKVRSTSNGGSYRLMDVISFIEIKFSIRGGGHFLVKSMKGLTLKGCIGFYEWLFKNVLTQEEYASLVNENGLLFDPAINTHVKLCLEAPTDAIVFINPVLYGAWDVKPEEHEAYKVVVKHFCRENWQNEAYFQNPVAVSNFFNKEEVKKLEPKKNLKSAVTEPVEATDEQKEIVKRTIDEVIVPQRIDITKGEPNWFQLGNAIYNVLGETEGRVYYHKLSQFYPGYSSAECDKKFSRIVKNGGYHYTFETFVYYCEMFNVQLNNF